MDRRGRLWIALFATLLMVSGTLALTALGSSAQASPSAPRAHKQHPTVATAPAGSAIRKPYVAAAKRQAGLHRHTLTAKWAHSKTPVPVCSAPDGGVSCMAVARKASSRPSASAVNSPSDPHFSGYTPADIQAAYGTAGMTQSPLVAVVDAYDDPGAEADLAAYRSEFHLPACTTANGCFTKVDQNGGTDYPPQDGAGVDGWIGEISLDLDAVSAACPTCHILLVEADSPGSLFQAVDEATALGATYVSMSWGDSEGGLVTTNGQVPARRIVSETDADSLSQPGVTYVASTGDDAYRYDATREPYGGLAYPASSPHVVAAGGVALNRDATTGVFSQTAWSWDRSTVGCRYTRTGQRCAGAGSGCSQLESAPSWQQGNAVLAGVCSAGRAGADISADADPNTGLYVWAAGEPYVFGGTSLAAPLLTSLYALTGEGTGSATGAVQTYAYANSSSLVDVTSGATGNCGNALCTSGAGWDGPTGLGTPDAPTDLYLPVTPTLTPTWPTLTYDTGATISVAVAAAVAPSGTVSLSEGSTTLDTKSLAGTGTTQIVELEVHATYLTYGSHTFTVRFVSDDPDVQSVTVSHTFSIKAAPTVTPTWPAFRYGTASTVKVTVNAATTPTGTVTLKKGSTPVATGTLSGTGTTGTASIVVPGTKLAAGRQPLTVSYSGNAEVAAKTLPAQTVTVARATPTVTASSPSSATYGKAFVVTIAVKASAAPSANGTVAVKWGSKVLASAHLPAGSATRKTVRLTVHTSALTAGRRPLTVTYAGDPNITAKTLPARAITVRTATPALTARWPAKIHHKAAFKVRVTVTASGKLSSGGTVTLRSGAKVLKSVRVPAGAATRTLTIKVAARKLAKGRHLLKLVYSGDANVGSRTSSHTVRVV